MIWGKQGGRAESRGVRGIMQLSFPPDNLTRLPANNIINMIIIGGCYYRQDTKLKLEYVWKQNLLSYAKVGS